MSTQHSRHQKPKTQHAQRKKSRAGKELFKQARRRAMRPAVKAASKPIFKSL